MSNRKSILLAAVTLVAWSLWQAGVFSKTLINTGGFSVLSQFFAAALHPDLSSSFVMLAAESALTTLAYAVCGLFISLLIGFVGGVFSSEVWHGGGPKPIRQTVRFALAGPRAIHEVIWALLFVNIIGLDSLSAILALGIPFGAITAKVFSEILDEVPRAPFMALRNAGATRSQALVYGLLPLALPNLISYSFYRFECAIRAAAVLGVTGAGGLGYQLLLSLQSLRYSQIWTLLYMLMALSGITDLWSSQLRRWMGTPSRLDINEITTGGAAGSAAPQCDKASPYWGAALPAVISVTAFTAVILSFWYVQPGWHKLFEPRALKLSAELLAALFPPNLSAELLSDLLPLALQTIAMSVLAIAIAAGGGMLLAYPAAQRSLTTLHGVTYVLRISVTLITRIGLLACRAVPAPVWALLLLFIFFPGLLPGALAIALHNLGILGRLLAETVENIDQRPVDALKAQGASTAQAFAYGVLPLTLPQGLAYSLYRWEVCVRETVIVGLVGAGGLGRLLNEQLSSFDFRAVVTTLVVFFILTFGVDIVSNKVRAAIR